ncbi:MAG: hypothetical protein RBS46_12930 [Methyloversatilis sp.]|jgi:hypothetical protein|nr:hypothetical protein [Methyloversatilis sp.]
MEQDAVRSAIALVNRVINSHELTARVKENPEVELPRIAEQIVKEMPPPPLDSDPWIYRIVVLALGGTVLIVVAGAVGLTAWHTGNDDVKIPELLTAIGSAAVGALAGLLAPSPGRK